MRAVPEASVSPCRLLRTEARMKRFGLFGSRSMAASRTGPTESSVPAAASARSNDSALPRSSLSGGSILKLSFSRAIAAVASPDSKHASARGSNESARTSRSWMLSSHLRASPGRPFFRSINPLFSAAAGYAGTSPNTASTSLRASSSFQDKARAPARITRTSWRRAFN